MTPEFSRTERVDTIGERERTVTVSADAAERGALATRFGLVSVDQLDGVFAIRRETSGISARGRVTATVVQACSVTGEPLPVRIDEAAALRFVAESPDAEEVELDSEALDTIPYEGGTIDLGEAAAETMALALDPFPRGPNAAAVLKAAGVISEDDAATGPLAGLKALLDRK